MKTALASFTICIQFGLLSCERHEASWIPHEGDRIGAVEIRYAGATSGHEPRLANFLQLTAGSGYSADAVDRDIRALYDSGYVEDVRVLAEPMDGDVRLVFAVTPRPPPGPPLFIGNATFSDKRLARELVIGVRTKAENLTEKERLEANAKAIEDFYRREGYSEVRVHMRAFSGGPATPDDFQFVIEEGEKQPGK